MSREHVVTSAELQSLRDLELVTRTTVEGLRQGLHRSPFHGFSAEFSQYRHYRPGDDLKYVDWKLFARTDRFYTKQYRETTNLMTQLAVDASASMAYAGSRSIAKLDYARLLAAALAHLISTQGDAVGLVVYDAGLRTYMPSRTGQAHLRGLLISLSKMEARGATASISALKRATDLLKRRGLLLVISDLYDEDAGLEEELRRATRIGHEVAVFHVLTREEIDFPFRGDVRLEDLESGRHVLAGVSSAANYRRAFAEFLERWRTRCASNGIDYTLVTTDVPLDAALRGYLLRRVAGTRR
jgi:uncharacterized protein (DUF58 family)